MKFLAGWRVLVCSSLLTSELFSLANWFSVETYSYGDRSLEPLAFLSGSFKGSQLRWATVDKEGFAIVNTFRRLEYLL